MPYLRREYHLWPMRIVWYLERYHDVKMSDAIVSRMLRRHGLNRLGVLAAGIDAGYACYS